MEDFHSASYGCLLPCKVFLTVALTSVFCCVRYIVEAGTGVRTQAVVVRLFLKIPRMFLLATSSMSLLFSSLDKTYINSLSLSIYLYISLSRDIKKKNVSSE